MATTNYYDDLFASLIRDSEPVLAAVEQVVAAYVDGKPQSRGKKKRTRQERDSLFWSCRTLRECPADSWSTEAMTLALARYLGQEPVAAEGLATRVAHQAPDVLIRAARYSGLVLMPHSARRSELEQAATANEEVAEFCRVLDSLDQAHLERMAQVDTQKALLEDLSAFDLLIYASLYAFERLVPRDFKSNLPATAADARPEIAWDALNALLAWKLEGATNLSLALNDDSIGRSVSQHLSPFLFESGEAISRDAIDRLRGFHALMDAQIELNDFIAKSAEAFCYDDSIRFERRGERLEIVEVAPALRAAWRTEGMKLERLHGYWFHRAMDAYLEYIAADPSRWQIGRPENADANRLAWLRALQAQLRLRDVYGVADDVASDSGETVNLFQALLSLNLMSAFFFRDFLAAFADRLGSGDWIAAVRRLAVDGLCGGLQNRLPLTWSGRAAKVANITGWTVTASEPRGNPRMASAILDFWTYDMVAMAERIRRREGLRPDFFERPVLKFGATLVQLPWIVGMQNNSTAAINNLKRLGGRTAQSRHEARRTEAGLARLLETRGFKTLLNWKPPRGVEDPGEVDLIATLGQHLFVFEVKSTYVRRSQKDAWLHATRTLRKAGHQLRRKTEAVSEAIASDPAFRALLNLTGDLAPTHRHGWIADTSIECDHQRFSGFLKVSIEELLIALRDDRHLLNDPEELLAGKYAAGPSSLADSDKSRWALYSDGFSVERFVDVIETQTVWDSTNRRKV